MLTLQMVHDILCRLDFPASREELIDNARAIEAPAEVLARLRTLPEHYYGSVNTVMDALQHQE